MNLTSLLTEQPNPASDHIDALATADVLAVINREDQGVALAVAGEIPRIAEAVDRIAELVGLGGRLFYIGAGTSGRLGVLDAAECPPTFQVSPEVVQGIMAGGEAALARATEASEDDPEAGKRDLAGRGFAANDALVGIAASGRTPYVLGAVDFANKLGALTVGISCTPESPLAAPRADCNHAVGGSGSDRRLHAHEGGDGDQAGLEHDQHRSHDSSGICFWQSDGERATPQQQAAGSRDADHRGQRGP